MIRNNYKVDSELRFKKKGARNKNNPSQHLKSAKEVIIVKQANYMDCISGHLCINDNIYKIYDVNLNPIFIDSDFVNY